MKLNRHGVHSLRTGGLAFLLSGSTTGPSSSTVHTRAGWSRKGKADTYLQYERAGDFYAGRLLCGLSVESANFSILSPNFYEIFDDYVDHNIVDEFINSLYGCTHHVGMNHLIHTCGALLLTQLEDLRELVTYFQPLSFLARLSIFNHLDVSPPSKFIHPCGFRGNPGHEHACASGPPPHVGLLTEIRDLKTALKDQEKHFEDVNSFIATTSVNNLNKYVDKLRKRNIAGSMSEDLVREWIVEGNRDVMASLSALGQQLSGLGEAANNVRTHTGNNGRHTQADSTTFNEDIEDDQDEEPIAKS
jgi:hypothetical protein